MNKSRRNSSPQVVEQTIWEIDNKISQIYQEAYEFEAKMKECKAKKDEECVKHYAFLKTMRELDASDMQRLRHNTITDFQTKGH